MEIDGSILYGNEWIDYDRSYVKITLDEDGIYKISRADLANNGIPVDQINLSNLNIFHLGKEK